VAYADEQSVPFKDQNVIDSASRTWAALTPHNSTNFAFVPRAVHCNACTDAAGGTFVAVGEDDTVGTFFARPGDIIPIRPKRINTTGLAAGMAFTGLK